MVKRSRASRERALGIDTGERPLTSARPDLASPAATGLTILCHPDLRRIGEIAPCRELSTGHAVAISRAAPEFEPPDRSERCPLLDPSVSRRPAFLRSTADGGAILARDPLAVALSVNGAPLVGERRLERDEIDRGVVVEVGQRVVLLIHRLVTGCPRLPDLGLVGESTALSELRRRILDAAELTVPALLLGETGTGKELVAEAIHRASTRAAEASVSVNMASISPSVAASELFGHARGAFTGALDDHPGYFVRAHKGTLFLDEIGECPVEVQAMLLRVLETGLVQAVGARSEQRVDVRLIAATDADLDDAVRRGAFRPALVHRLSGYVIHVPPLRERREDIGRLFLHFARQELDRLGASGRLDHAEEERAPWIPAPLIARLARYDWPGNVRELRNVVRQLVLSNRTREVMVPDRAIERLLEEPARGKNEAVSTRVELLSKETAPPLPRRKPSEVTEAELIGALRAHRYRPDAAAADLGISRPSLYALIDRSERLRKAKDIPREEIERCERELGGDLDAMAERLEVSKRGLAMRLGELFGRRQ